jgi:hypothetical protein
LVRGGDSEHVNEASCRPATWWTTKRALSPLAIQRSYKARKSSLFTGVNVDGGHGGDIGGGALGGAPSRTMFAHEGVAQGATPSTPGEGEAWGASLGPACLYLPSPSHGGEADWRGGRWRGECCVLAAVDRPCDPSACGEGEAAGSMAGGPLSRGGEREQGPHASGVSSELL